MFNQTSPIGQPVRLHTTRNIILVVVVVMMVLVLFMAIRLVALNSSEVEVSFLHLIR